MTKKSNLHLAMRIKTGFICCMTLMLTSHLSFGAVPTIPAFVNAGGGGAVSVGGRGGRIVEVTTLADSGNGSLREAITANGPRTIVFRKAGTIELETALIIRSPYITIAGQSAPGGILLSGKKSNESLIEIITHDVILRYLRLRKGASLSSGNADGIGVYNKGYNIIVDHCSLSWATDECLDIWSTTDPAHNVTFSWNIIAETLAGHSTGLLTGSDVNSAGMLDIAVHHNLFINNSHRNPLIKVGSARVINNIAYNFSNWSIGFGGGTRIDIIGNIAKAGLLTNTKQSHILHRPQSFFSKAAIGPPGRPSIYIKHNLDWNITNPETPNWTMIEEAKDWVRRGIALNSIHCQRDTPQADLPFPVLINSVDKNEAFVLESVGASQRLNEIGDWVGAQDAVDIRLLAEYKSGTQGVIPAHENEVGGFPAITTGSAYLDNDHDGMADPWEILFDLNPISAADGNLDADGDGFTNVEEFLSGTNPTISNTGSTVFSLVPVLGDRANFLECRTDAWQVITDGGELRYHLASTNYEAAGVGRLGQWSLVADHRYRNVSISAKVRSGEDLNINGGADICLILGWQDEENYYYAMYNRKKYASSIFLVLDGERIELANAGKNSFVYNRYHGVEFRRNGDLLEMLFDGLVVASSTDNTFSFGRIGVGSYDDSVFFDDIRVKELM
jgi:pectate lyase